MINITNGCAPGSNAPNRKAPGAANSKGLMTDTNRVNFARQGLTNQAPVGNVIAHQIARLALAGHSVHDGGTGDFLVSKYGLSRYCKDFAELQAFARQLGVK